MSRSRRDRDRPSRFACALTVLTVTTSPAAAGAAARQDPPIPAPAITPATLPDITAGESVLLLDVRVNGWPLGLVARFYESEGRLSLPAEQLDGLGFVVDEAWVTTVGEERRVQLDRIPGLEWRIDRPNQIIDITAPFDRLQPHMVEVAPSRPRVPARADWGAMLAYDAFGQWSRRPDDLDFSRTVSVNLDARIFSPWFSATTTGFVTFSEGEAEEYTRLESWIDFDSPDDAWRVRVGDSFTAGPVWIRPFRFGGVQWMRDFSIRPDIVTTPTPELRQDIALPSTVDLFINGIQRYSTAVDPGALRLTDLPIVAGSNMVSVVFTDQAGRRTQLLLPLYSSTLLLAEGMSTFNVEAGASRQNFSVESNDYRGEFLSGAFAYGVTDEFTLSAYGAAAEGYSTAAGGAAFSLGSFLVVDSALMISSGPEGQGWGWFAGVEHVGPRFTLAAQYFESDGYRDLADLFGYLTFDRRATVSAGVDLGWAGHLNVAYVMQRELDGLESQVVSGTWGVNLFRDQVHLGASAYAELEDESWGAVLSLTFPLGGDTQAYVQENWRDGEEDSSTLAQIRGEAFDDRLTWVVEGERGPIERGEVTADWDGRYTDLHLAAMTSDGSTAFELGLAQSFVVMANQFFVAGRIDDAFAVVEVEDSPGVRVALENTTVGRTDSHGRILITDLQSYAANAISIESLDLPLDANIRDTATLVAPRGGSGVLTRFAVTRARSALVTLRMPDGTPPPVGARVKIAGVEEEAVAGFDGEIYLRGLNAGDNRLELTWPDGRCTTTFNAAITEGSLPRLGPFTCAP